MKQRSLRPVLLLGVLIAGCVPSLHPIYADGDVVFDEALVGLWRDVDSSGEAWHFTPASGDAYRLVYTEGDGKAGAFEVHLARVGGALFLDLFPEEPEPSASSFYKGHLIRAHTFLLVEGIEPELRLRAVETGWLSEYLGRHPDALAHAGVGDGLVITAPTEELLRATASRRAPRWNARSKRATSRRPGRRPTPVVGTRYQTMLSPCAHSCRCARPKGSGR